MPVPVVYVSDFTDPADTFDRAYLECSADHVLLSVCNGGVGLAETLSTATEPVNLVVTASYAAVAAVLDAHPALFRARVARLFLVGGHANDYSAGREGERLPFDPRLRERNPERFADTGDCRVTDAVNAVALGQLLTSGEAVIWLPRDVCLWRYAAPGILEDDPSSATLLATLTQYTGNDHDPVLLSSLPAFCLAAHPNPMPWLRLFRAAPARVSVVPESGAVTEISLGSDRPNLYLVVAIDSRACGARVTQTLKTIHSLS